MKDSLILSCMSGVFLITSILTSGDVAHTTLTVSSILFVGMIICGKLEDK